MWFIVLESARKTIQWTLKGHFNLQNRDNIFSSLHVVIFIRLDCFGVGFGDVVCLLSKKKEIDGTLLMVLKPPKY